jgi:hypothetical protein
MYVLERSGVTWDEKFYVRMATPFPWSPRPGSVWGGLESARKFDSEREALGTSCRLRDEEGLHTTVEETGSFSEPGDTDSGTSPA